MGRDDGGWGFSSLVSIRNDLDCLSLLRLQEVLEMPVKLIEQFQKGFALVLGGQGIKPLFHVDLMPSRNFGVGDPESREAMLGIGAGKAEGATETAQFKGEVWIGWSQGEDQSCVIVMVLSRGGESRD